jgi:hypothetical protein
VHAGLGNAPFEGITESSQVHVWHSALFNELKKYKKMGWADKSLGCVPNGS